MLRAAISKRIFLNDKICQTFAKFDRTKPHVNVGTIGHIDHGKTTLTSAITKFLAEKNKAKYVQYAKIDKAPQEKARGITINTATLQYETDKRHYAHVDCPGHIDYVKNMITGAAKMDAGILVVSAIDGPMPQTKEHVLLCRQIGVNNIIVFLNKMDLIKQNEMVDVIQMQLKELLKKHQYDPEKTRFVRGSAISAIQDNNPEIGMKKIQQLLNAMDQCIPVTGRPIDKPFLMSVQGTYNIGGRGAVASGTIQQGKVKVGDQIQFFGYGSKMKSAITGIQTFNKTLDYGEAGDNVGLLIRGLTREQIHRGLIIGKPGSLATAQFISANIYCLTTQQGGRKNSFSSGYRPQLYYKTADTAVEIQLPQNTKIAKPGDNLSIKAKLHFPLTITKGSRFALRQGGKTIAAGVVTQILPDTTQINPGKGGKKPKQQAEGAKPADGTTPAQGAKPADGAKKPVGAKTDAKKGDKKPKQAKPQGQKKQGDKKPKQAKPQGQKKQGSKSAPKQGAKDAKKPAPANKDGAPKQGAQKDKPAQKKDNAKKPESAPKPDAKTPPKPPAAGGKAPPAPPKPAAGSKSPPPAPPKPAGKTPPPPPKPAAGKPATPPPPKKK